MRINGGKETQRHVLVDGGNLVHRAFYAYVEARIKTNQTPFMTSSGFATGVIYGSLRMLSSWLHSMERVTKISIFFDGKPSRRRVIDPSYKSNRSSIWSPSVPGSIPDERFVALRDGFKAQNQMDVLAHILPILGCDVYFHPEEEADDLIASFCASNPDTIRIIVSDDKDFFQLLTDPRIIIYRPGSKDDNKFVDAESSEILWSKLNRGNHPSVPPSYVRMFKSLCGDASDGIPGVERLRKKVAVPLCSFQNVEDLYASGFPGFSDSEKDRVISSKSRVATNFELVGLISDIDLKACLIPSKPDFSAISEILVEDLEMNSVDVAPFRSVIYPDIQTRKSIPTQDDPVIPIPDWLSNI